MELLDAIAAESRAVFTGEFAIDGTFTPQGGSARPACGIYDEISELTDIGALISADGVAALYNVNEADFTDARLGDTLLVNNTTYRVVGREPDGTGRLVLVLGL